MLVGKFVTGDT